MTCITVIRPINLSSLLENKLKTILEGQSCSFLTEESSLPDLKYKKILFVLEADVCGFCIPLFNILRKLYTRGCDSLKGSVGAVIVISQNELFTKTLSRNIIFLANQLGCSFIGHPVVEAIKDFNNFHTWKKTINLSLEEIFNLQSRKLIERLIDDKPIAIENPKITVIHSSQHTSSNTLMFWNMIDKHLPYKKVNKFKIENGEILDCHGCSFKACNYYSKQKGCFYGGIMTDQIYPNIEDSDVLILICPNYNDALSANLTAFINRLTALYRRVSFYDKIIFAVIVSGNSGSDSVAMQIIGSLVINKGFRLPPHFAAMEVAYDPEAIKEIPSIDDKSKNFANIIVSSLNMLNE